MKDLAVFIAFLVIVFGGMAVIAFNSDEQTVTYINDECVHIKEAKNSLFGEDVVHSDIYCQTPMTAQ